LKALLRCMNETIARDCTVASRNKTYQMLNNNVIFIQKRVNGYFPKVHHLAGRDKISAVDEISKNFHEYL